MLLGIPYVDWDHRRWKALYVPWEEPPVISTGVNCDGDEHFWKHGLEKQQELTVWSYSKLKF